MLRLGHKVHSGIFKTTPVVYVDDTGLQDLIILETLQITDEVRGFVGDNYFRHSLQLQPDLITKWLVKGIDPLVDEVLENFVDQPTWNSLYNIYQIIQSNVEESLFRTWTNGWGRRFKHTANNNKANPSARHSSVRSQGTLPAKFQPMPLLEATEHIAALIRDWLQNKKQ